MLSKRKATIPEQPRRVRPAFPDRPNRKSNINHSKKLQMSQTAQGLLNANKARLQAEKPAKEVILNKAKTFHQKQLEKKAADPENTGFHGAVALGRASAKAFLRSVIDPKHPDHEKNLATFKNDHGSDSRKTITRFIDQACKDLDEGPFELADPAYEQHVIAKYKPQGNVTHEQVAFHNNFQKAMGDKWARAGYAGDQPFVDAYTDKYGLKPTNDSGLRDFALRK
jgi:hypothetical protein